MGIKHSKSITLVLIASLTALTSACSEDPGNQQLYRSGEDCLKDWQDPRYCEQNTSSSYPHTYYYGPRYYVDDHRVYATTRSGQLETVGEHIPIVRGLATGRGGGHSTSITRGGFGGSASAHFGGGS